MQALPRFLAGGPTDMEELMNSTSTTRRLKPKLHVKSMLTFLNEANSMQLQQGLKLNIEATVMPQIPNFLTQSPVAPSKY